MTLRLFLIALISTSIRAAPTEGPIKIELEIPNPSGYINAANEKLNTYTTTALENVKTINDLVSENLIQATDTISDTFNTGLTVTSDAVQTASNVVSNNLDAASKFATQASTLVYNTAVQGAKTLKDGAQLMIRRKSELISPITNPSVGLFEEQPRKLESAILEQEDVGSRIQTAKENFGQLFSGFLQPKPITDTITEEEKYGNNGDKFEGVGRALVTGSESIANFFSNAVNVPFDFVKSITRSASARLNNFGSKLIGL